MTMPEQPSLASGPNPGAVDVQPVAAPAPPVLTVAPDPIPEGATLIGDAEWVLLKPAKAIRQKDRKQVMAAIDAANMETAAMMAATSVQDRIACLVIADWSFAHPTDDTPPLWIPSVTLDALDELEIPYYDAISALCEPYMDTLFPDFTPDGADNENRVGPTGTSNA